MTAIRFGSLVMMLVLTVPMVRDCCLPVTHTLPCHQSRHTDDVTCSSSQQAITETKATLSIGLSIDCESALAAGAESSMLTHMRCVLHAIALAPRAQDDRYLQTGALLI
jgi:hypothetical protein